MINWKWLYQQLPKPLLMALLIFSALGGFEGVLNGYVLGQVPNLTAATTAQRLQYVASAAALYLGTYTCLYLSLRLQQSAIKIWNVALKSHLLRLSGALKEPGSKGINRLTNDANQIEARYFRLILDCGQNLMMTVISIWFVLAVNWLMGLVFVAFSALTMVPMVIAEQPLAKLGQRSSDANAETVAQATDWLNGLAELGQYGAAQTFFKRVNRALHRSERRMQQQTVAQYTAQFATWLLVVLALFGPMVIGFLLMAHGDFGITISTLLTLQLSADHVTLGVRSVINDWSQLASTKQLRQLPPIPVSPVPAAMPGDGRIKLNQTTLKFDSRTLLLATDLTIPAGAKVLIAGPSGIGKSSLLNLIAGRLEPSSGSITVGGQTPRPTSVTYITQSAYIFKGTIRENLTLMQAFTDDELLTVLAQVQLTSELGTAPLERMVDPDALSGGQKQRLALARGLLRKRPILLLDEITAGLDDQSAHTIRQVLYALPVTLVEVAHHYDKAMLSAFHFTVLTLNAGRLAPMA